MSAAQQIRQLDDQLRRLRYMNENMHKQLFNASHRGDNLAKCMGFEGIEEAESAIAEHPDVFNRAFIEHAEATIICLEEQIAKRVDLDMESREALRDASQEMSELKQENEQLKLKLSTVNGGQESPGKKLDRSDSHKEALSGRTMLSAGLLTPISTGPKKRPLQDVTPHNTPVAPTLSANSGQHQDAETLLSSSSLRLPGVVISSTDPVLLSTELRELRKKYDALRQAKERNDAKYKEDYVKWRNFKRWMFDEQEASLSSIMVDGKAPNWNRIMQLRKKYRKIGPRDSASTIVEKMGGESAKNGFVTPSTNDRNEEPHIRDVEEHSASELPYSSLTTHLLEEAQLKDGHQPDGLAAPRSNSSLPQQELDHRDAELSSSPSRRRGRKRKFEETPSSETEDDSQGPDPVYETQPGLHRIRAPASPTESQCRAELRPPYAGSRGMRSPRSKRHALSSRSDRSNGPASPQTRPSDFHDVTPRQLASNAPNAAEETTPVANSGADKENAGSSSSTSRKLPIDYSTYKGRGRYAAHANAGKTTINAQYKIDSSNNEGVDFRFHDVVRNREHRKHLKGCNCETCRNYYELVGPMPPRLKPPLWRSPEASPSKLPGNVDSTDPDFNGGDAVQQQQEIQEHMNEISRHRQQWDCPSTPPLFWDIGMPDTQQVAEINERAREIHEEKEASIRQEAMRNGRYKMRK